MDVKQDKPWKHLLAGALAGSIAVCALQPFDVIKTRMQVQDGIARGLPEYKGFNHAVRIIWSTEGYRGFFSGLAPALIGSGVSWGAYFYIYESLKQYYERQQGRKQLSPLWNLTSAAQAGAAVCLFTNPIWLLKTRLQLQVSTTNSQIGSMRGTQQPAASAYGGLLDAISRIAREEGPRGFYRGLAPSLVLQSSHGAVQFAVYEELKKIVRQADSAERPPQAGDSPRRQSHVAAWQLPLCGAVSKFAAVIVTYPVQVVRTRLQQRSTSSAVVYSTTWDVVKLTLVREGVRGFYKGLLAALMRTMPQSAVVFAVYEQSMTLLGMV